MCNVLKLLTAQPGSPSCLLRLIPSNVATKVHKFTSSVKLPPDCCGSGRRTPRYKVIMYVCTPHLGDLHGIIKQIKRSTWFNGHQHLKDSITIQGGCWCFLGLESNNPDAHLLKCHFINRSFAGRLSNSTACHTIQR